MQHRCSNGRCFRFHLEESQERHYFFCCQSRHRFDLPCLINILDQSCGCESIVSIGDATSLFEWSVFQGFHLEESQERIYFLLLPIETSIRSTVSNQVSWSESWLWIYCFDRSCNSLFERSVSKVSSTRVSITTLLFYCCQTIHRFDLPCLIKFLDQSFGCESIVSIGVATSLFERSVF